MSGDPSMGCDVAVAADERRPPELQVYIGGAERHRFGEQGVELHLDSLLGSSGRLLDP